MLFLISQGVKFVNLNGKLFRLCQDLKVERNRKNGKGNRRNKYLSEGTDNNKYDLTRIIEY